MRWTAASSSCYPSKWKFSGSVQESGLPCRRLSRFVQVAISHYQSTFLDLFIASTCFLNCQKHADYFDHWSARPCMKYVVYLYDTRHSVNRSKNVCWRHAMFSSSCLHERCFSFSQPDMDMGWVNARLSWVTLPHSTVSKTCLRWPWPKILVLRPRLGSIPAWRPRH